MLADVPLGCLGSLLERGGAAAVAMIMWVMSHMAVVTLRVMALQMLLFEPGALCRLLPLCVLG